MGLSKVTENDTDFVVFSITRIAVGLALCIVGYRYFRVAMPLVAFYVGGDFLATVVSVLRYGTVQTAKGYWISLFLGGVICGGIAAAHLQTGVVLTGSSMGILFAVLLLDMVDMETDSELRIVLMTIAGAISGVIVWKLQRLAVLAAIAFVGASQLIHGARYLSQRLKTTSASSSPQQMHMQTPTAPVRRE